ncbi:MAG: hypothetical protein F4043_13485 [Gammaproteobacteria bacterium]|nr:hypothetical protein [Gammaproteobacteria bacterium]MYI23696.1 hypothetical protein [Gammaproteobacteria bacterium]
MPLVVQRDSAGIEIVEATRPLWDDSSLWRVDPEPLLDLALSGSGPNHEFHRARSMIQRPDGSLAVADRGSQQVRVFSEAGEFQESFGGPGEGPGEFSNLWRIENAGDTLLVLDSRRRVTVVTPRLALVRTFNLANNTSSLHNLGGGTMLTVGASPGLPEARATGVIRPAEILALVSLEGVEIDDIGETPGSESYVSVGENYASGAPLFGKTAHVAVLGQRIFRGTSDAMEVEELDMTGSLVRILRIPGYPLDLSADRIAAEREARLEELPSAVPAFIRRLVEDLPAPATRPAYANMLVDPSGAVWLELYRGVSERDRPQEWLILDADGTWLGNVEVPRRFTVMEVGMDRMLGVWRDEVDVEHPQVLRLTRN